MKRDEGLRSRTKSSKLRGAGLRLFASPGGITQEVELGNAFNNAYFGEIEVGTPGQPVTVIFDTGSADLWVSSVATSSGKGRFFDRQRSRTYVDSGEVFEIKYGSGPIKGTFCEDRVAIGELTLEKFNFAEVSDTSSIDAVWDGDLLNGIMGLGFSALSKSPGLTVMEALVQSGQLERPVFGFYLGDGEPGQLILGGVDPNHIAGEFAWVDLVMEVWWAVALDQIDVGNVLRLTATPTAVVDSGTSLIAGPKREVDAIIAMLGAESFGGLYLADCKAEVPDLSLTMGGVALPLTLKDLTLEEVEGYCVLGIQSIDIGFPVWILGDVFMRKYYVQFDWGRKRLGFALSRRANSTTPNVTSNESSSETWSGASNDSSNETWDEASNLSSNETGNDTEPSNFV